LVNGNRITDPFGGTNSTKIVAPTGAGLKLLRTIPTVSSGTTVTASLYVKNAGGRYVIFYLNDSTSRMLRVDLQTGTITSNSADSGTIESLDNDWYRISFTRTLDTNLGGVLICPSLDGSNVSFEGNGTDGLYIYGAQLEETVYEDTPSGSELVTNGDFATDSDWTKHNAANTITGGKAVNTSAPSGSGFQQNINAVQGRYYTVTFTVSNYVEGEVKVRHPFNSATVSSNESKN
jgi:hypothetical protein